MRHRKLVSAAFSLFLSLGPAAGASAACWVCSPTLQCVQQAMGARMCVQSTLSCAMILPCFSGGGRVPDSEEGGLTTLTLFDALEPQSPEIEPDAGPLSLGEEARGSRGVGRGHLVEAMLAHGTDFEVKLLDAQGRGFAIRRREAGGAVRLEVLDVLAEQPGRILAEGVLRERDRLVTTVHVEGHDRILVVQAVRSPAAALSAETARLRNALQRAAGLLPPREKPLLNAREM